MTAPDSAQMISVRVSNVTQGGQVVWMAMQVARRTDQHIHFQAEVLTAVAQDALCSAHPPSASEAQIIKADVVGGILLARKQIGRIGFHVELISLGASIDGAPALSGVPSVAFGVAANLAVLHGVGAEDLAAHPRGGFGWRLDSITATPSSF